MARLGQTVAGTLMRWRNCPPDAGGQAAPR